MSPAPENAAGAQRQTGQVGQEANPAAKNAGSASASFKQGIAVGTPSEKVAQEARAAGEAGAKQNRDAPAANSRAAPTSAQSGVEGRARAVSESSGHSASATEGPRPAASKVPTDRALAQAALPSAQAQSAVSGQKASAFNAVSVDGKLQRAVSSLGQGISTGPGDGELRGRGDGNPLATRLPASGLGKGDAAAARKAETIRVFISRLDSAVQVMRQENNSTIQLRVSMERGEVIKIRLNLRGATLKTTIHVESDAIRQQLRSSWNEVSQALAEQGVAAESPDFDEGSDASSGQQEHFEDEGAGATSHPVGNGQSGSVGDGSSEASSAAPSPTDSRAFSRTA